MTDPNPIVDLIPIIASQDGPVLAVFGDDRRFGTSGTRRDTTPMLRFSSTSTVPDTLGTWGGKVWSFVSVGGGIAARSLLAFGPDLFISGNADRAVLAESHVPRIAVFGSDGHLQSVLRWTEQPSEVTEQEYREWQEAREAELPDELDAATREALMAVPSYGSHPVLNGVLIGQDGTIWLAPNVLLDGRDQTWLRFTPEGDPFPTVSLEQGARPLDATATRVAVMDRDEVGVELVSVFEVEGAP
jgi:hypothetical protein